MIALITLSNKSSVDKYNSYKQVKIKKDPIN